jgi:hypothetical protein
MQSVPITTNEIFCNLSSKCQIVLTIVVSEHLLAISWQKPAIFQICGKHYKHRSGYVVLFQYYDFILPGVPEAFKPNTRFDIIQWTYFTDSHIYFDDDFTNIRPLKGIILHN